MTHDVSKCLPETDHVSCWKWLPYQLGYHWGPTLLGTWPRKSLKRKPGSKLASTWSQFIFLTDPGGLGLRHRSLGRWGIVLCPGKGLVWCCRFFGSWLSDKAQDGSTRKKLAKASGCILETLGKRGTSCGDGARKKGCNCWFMMFMW